jgi:FtsP/CotA-like multicopper oxidase with cupredoxin domain
MGRLSSGLLAALALPSLLALPAVTQAPTRQARTAARAPTDVLAARYASDPTAPLPSLPDTLRQPPILPDRSSVPGVVEVDLTAAPARLRLVPGRPPVQAWAYNGTVPGPTLDVHEGDSVIVHFHNQLPEPTTVHWHGLHLAIDADGSPLRLVAPGASYDYVFRIPRGEAGTYWYHPHPDRRTTHQVAMGLFGAIIIRARHDPLSEAGIPEKLLVLSDDRFAADGSVSFPDSGSIQEEIDLENGREGPALFVNGQVNPTVPMRSGQVERWRIVDASAARVYRLAVPGQRLVHVGSDGGLFEHPVRVPEIVLANSGRVEVLVRGTGAPGSRRALQDLPYDRYMPQTRPADWDSTRTLLTIETTRQPPAKPVAIPAELRPVPRLDTTHVARRRTIVMSQGQIDGKRMDLGRVDTRARLGTTEIWTVENVVGMDHPFHLHGFHFQVLDRDGVPEPFPSWKDTVNVPKHSSVRLVVHFADFPGKWMYHCHILDHEDEGMMGILQVY